MPRRTAIALAALTATAGLLAGCGGGISSVGATPAAHNDSSSSPQAELTSAVTALGDARTSPDRPRVGGPVAAVEALGPEQLVYVEIDGRPVLADDVLEGLVDAEAAGELAEIKDADGQRATVVARFDASASVRPDDAIELAVDTRHLHFFDLETGSAIDR